MDYRPGESYCSQLCQHPTCWEGQRLEERGLFRPVEICIHKETLYEDLPTQKIINMSVELDELPYDDDFMTLTGPDGFRSTFVERILRHSKSHRAALNSVDSDGQPKTEIKKAGIHTFRAKDLIGDWSEAIVPNKYYIWVPSAQKTSEQSRSLSPTAPGKMAVKTISVNASQSHPTHRFEPGTHRLRLRQKSQFSGTLRGRSSKENSSLLSSNVGLEPHYVSLNSSALDQRNLPVVLSRAPTITLPDSSLPVHKSFSHPLSGVKNTSKDILTPAKQVEKDNGNVDPIGKTLPPIDAMKYGRTKSNLVKQSKLSSILLEPCFDFHQRKSWTSGTFWNYGSNKLNVEPSVSATHQLNSTEDDPDILDAQKWFKIEAHNQSSPLGNDKGDAQPVTTPINTPTAGITPFKKPVNELPEEESGSTAKGLTRSATLTSPLRRATSKVVTFAPASRSLSSCSISLTKSPNARRNMSATSLGLRVSGEMIIRKDESNHSDQPAQPPYPPPPSPEPKNAGRDAESGEGPVFLVDRGDSESVITITARPPTNFEDESVINTPGQSSLARSRESTRDRLTRKASAKQTSGMEETGGRTIGTTETSRLSPGEATHCVESAIDQLASEIVAEVLTSTYYILTKKGESINNGGNEMNGKHTIASQDMTTEDKSKETLPDVDFKATNLFESPDHHCPDSSVTDCPQPLQLQHDGLDQFDATEEDFKKELLAEYDKL